MEFGGQRKRGRVDGGLVDNGGYKKSKQDMGSFTTASKSKPCTKFFSISGCPFGDGCHFMHNVPGGIKAVTQMLGSNPALPATSRNPVVPPSFPDGSTPPPVKTRLCNKFSTPEGCKFQDKCHFAHGEHELGKPALWSHEDPRAMGPMHGRYSAGRMAPAPPNLGPTAGFGASATTKISIDASLAGPVIGKGGVKSKQICRLTGAKLAINDHETDPNLRNIELEGTFDQIKQASQMVRDLIMNVSAKMGPSMKNRVAPGGRSGSNSNFKTKLCEKFAEGSCTFGDRCHFAHGEEERRPPAV